MSKNVNKLPSSKMNTVRKQYRILDESTRNRRTRQQIEQLERDNFHEDPHSNLVLHKKIPKFEDINVANNNLRGGGSGSGSHISSRRSNTRPRTFTLSALIDENSRMPAPNYLTILTRSLAVQKNDNNPTISKTANNICLPTIKVLSVKRNFCSVCGFRSNYTCIICGLKYCSSHCLQVHQETRCLKWTS